MNNRKYFYKKAASGGVAFCQLQSGKMGVKWEYILINKKNYDPKELIGRSIKIVKS